jgi:PAS domain S-box-containing protein
VARRVEAEAEATEPERGQPELLVDVPGRDLLPILLVDDRPENLQTLRAVLEPLGFPLVAASSGGEALRLLLERDFALILLDVRMPGLDGLETAGLIKGRGRSSDVPIVFLTAARDEVEDIIRGYGVGAVDYVLKPFDPELLRSKVAVFAELETSRRALKRSEALLRGAFEAAPIGKTVLDSEGRIIRANPAFARLVGHSPEEVQGMPVADLCDPKDVPTLRSLLDRAGHAGADLDVQRRDSVDLRLKPEPSAEVWVGAVASLIEPTELAEQLRMVQWVDLTTRRRAERARADLLLEQAARAQAEAMAHRLTRLQELSSALESLRLEELLGELAVRLAAMHDVETAEVEVGEKPGALILRARGGEATRLDPGERREDSGDWEEVPLQSERTRLGSVRLKLGPDRSLDEGERSLLREAADRAALSIRRAQLHEEEHRIAVELQRGLIPASLPSVAGVELAAHYEAAGLGAEVGGDWYDAFALPSGRLGVVLGDVAGSGIRAASTMGQLRSVTRAFALADEAVRSPGEVLTRLNSYRLALDEHQLFTVLYAIVDPSRRSVQWASAGHPPPLRAGDGGEVSYLETGDGLMGVEEKPYTTLEAELAAGDLLVLYTDGLVERRGESLDAGLERLANVVTSGPKSPDPLREHVLEQLVGSGEPPNDDVTAVVLKLV